MPELAVSQVSDAVLKLDNGRQIPIDEKGYLLDRSDWGLSVAEHMAGNDGISLTEEHLEILRIFQAYFEEYEIEPPMRALVKLTAAKLGKEKGNSRFLYRLFPQGPTTQACRYAGLPRPLSCI